jgi:hypothetical protein
MTQDSASTAAEAAADVVRTHTGRVDRRDELAARVQTAVGEVLHRPQVIGRSIEGEPSPADDAVISYLAGRPTDIVGRIAVEALGRQGVALELRELGLDP